MTVELHLGDCLEVMRGMADKSVDTIITDPPYGLEFMGKDWDKGVPGVAFWQAAYRVAKPGAILLAFGGTRTYHRLACAIEDAGFEIRDTIAWVYGSGFPKSYDISKGIDKQAGAEREVAPGRHLAVKGEMPIAGPAGRCVTCGKWRGSQPGNCQCEKHTAPSTPAAILWHGWGTALKPAFEPIVVAMKPIDGTFVNNALTWGVAGLNIDGGRVGTDEVGARPRSVSESGNTNMLGVNAKINFQGAPTQGRFPANFIHDGSDEVVGLFPQSNGDSRKSKPTYESGYWGNANSVLSSALYNDSGSAARFFYCAKASRSERNAGLEGMPEKLAGSYEFRNRESGKGQFDGATNNKRTNHHPTVKPIELMRYLVRLTKTPTGGIVLDPFMGSGTTGCACVLEGREFVGIELEAEYLEIAEKRISHAQGLVPVELPLFVEAL